ncbi:helix-turn-helix transcriptional regulator [bacterium]|nr:helix-turn-helix transcriptional regulator [bacterium]
MNIKILFGKKIKELRKKYNYTQAKLAELVAVDDKHISCIENGKNFPSPELIDRLANAFKVDPKDLFEFYHLQTPECIKNDLIEIINNLNDDEVVLAYKYIRNFIIK